MLEGGHDVHMLQVRGGLMMGDYGCNGRGCGSGGRQASAYDCPSLYAMRFDPLVITLASRLTSPGLVTRPLIPSTTHPHPHPHPPPPPPPPPPQVAQQAAEVLLLMRPEGEPVSDFQDYTVITLAAVAAHLTGAARLGRASVAALTDTYGHDPTALEQVFHHVVHILAYFRSLCIRRHVLADESALEHAQALARAQGAQGPGGAAALLEGLARAGQPPEPVVQTVVKSELDDFGARILELATVDLPEPQARDGVDGVKELS